MKYELFLDLISANKQLIDNYSNLHDMGFDFFEGKFKLVEITERLFNVALSSHYTEDAVEWVNWFMYENDFGELGKNGKTRLTAYDSTGALICYSVKSLWEHLEENHKLNA